MLLIRDTPSVMAIEAKQAAQSAIGCPRGESGICNVAGIVLGSLAQR
jgi:hypothetical protein